MGGALLESKWPDVANEEHTDSQGTKKLGNTT